MTVRSVPFLDIGSRAGGRASRRGAARSNARQWLRVMHAQCQWLPRILTQAAAGGMAGDAEEGSTTYGIYGGSILSGSRTESPIGSPAE